jgi:hypothetical protein
MGIASLTLVALSACFTLFALIPCVGWLNFIAVPMCFVTSVVGIVGLASDKDPASGEPRGRSAHLMAVIFGLILGCVAFVRWVLGGFVV